MFHHSHIGGRCAWQSVRRLIAMIRRGPHPGLQLTALLLFSLRPFHMTLCLYLGFCAAPKLLLLALVLSPTQASAAAIGSDCLRRCGRRSRGLGLTGCTSMVSHGAVSACRSNAAATILHWLQEQKHLYSPPAGPCQAQYSHCAAMNTASMVPCPSRMKTVVSTTGSTAVSLLIRCAASCSALCQLPCFSRAMAQDS